MPDWPADKYVLRRKGKVRKRNENSGWPQRDSQGLGAYIRDKQGYKSQYPSPALQLLSLNVIWGYQIEVGNRTENLNPQVKQSFLFCPVSHGREMHLGRVFVMWSDCLSFCHFCPFRPFASMLSAFNQFFSFLWLKPASEVKKMVMKEQLKNTKHSCHWDSLVLSSILGVERKRRYICF